jgi:hypothetical protein
VEPLAPALIALLPEDPAHKTRTWARDGDSGAVCACHWARAGQDRHDARRQARSHRREMAAALAERNGRAERLRDLPPERIAALIAEGKVA